MLTGADVMQRADTHLATPEFARASSVVLAVVRVLLQPCGGERQGTQFAGLTGTKVQILTQQLAQKYKY